VYSIWFKCCGSLCYQTAPAMQLGRVINAHILRDHMGSEEDLGKPVDVRVAEGQREIYECSKGHVRFYPMKDDGQYHCPVCGEFMKEVKSCK